MRLTALMAALFSPPRGPPPRRATSSGAAPCTALCASRLSSRTPHHHPSSSAHTHVRGRQRSCVKSALGGAAAFSTPPRRSCLFVVFKRHQRCALRPFRRSARSSVCIRSQHGSTAVRLLSLQTHTQHSLAAPALLALRSPPMHALVCDAHQTNARAHTHTHTEHRHARI